MNTLPTSKYAGALLQQSYLAKTNQHLQNTFSREAVKVLKLYLGKEDAIDGSLKQKNFHGSTPKKVLR